MKRVIYFFIVILGSFGVAALQGLQPSIHNIAVNPEQMDRLKSMVKVLKYKTKRHCDLCEIGKNPRYMNAAPQEFDSRFKKSAEEIEGTIREIVTLYKEVGVDLAVINQEEREMRANINAYLKK